MSQAKASIKWGWDDLNPVHLVKDVGNAIGDGASAVAHGIGQAANWVGHTVVDGIDLGEKGISSIPVVGKAFGGAFQAVAAPIKFVGNVAQGKNVANSAGQAVGQAATGAWASNGANQLNSALLTSSPIVTKVTSSLTGGLSDIYLQENSIANQTIAQTGYIDKKSGLLFTRDSAELAAVAGAAYLGGAAIAAHPLTAVGSASLAKSAFSGNVNAITQLGGDALGYAGISNPLPDLSPYQGLLPALSGDSGSSGGGVPAASSPPFPYFTPGSVTPSFQTSDKAQASSQTTYLLLAAGIAAATILKKRKG